MPGDTGQRLYTQTKGYDIQLIIEDKDYTLDLVSVRVLSSLSTAYQVVLLNMSLDPNDILLEKIFGSGAFKISIRLLGENAIPQEQVDLELMFIKADYSTIEKDQSSEGLQKDRVPYVVTTVCRKPWKTMNTLVNKVFINTTIPDVISSLASDVGTTVEYDTYNQNTDPIDQIVIPPTTFYKIIKECDHSSPDIYDGFLERYFGLFNGVSGVFCRYDNKVFIKNLSAKMRMNQTFTIYQLAGGREDTDIIESSFDGETFYTYGQIKSDYSGNAKLAVLAPTIRNIVSPEDSLTYTYEQNLEDMASRYGLIYQNSKIEVDPNISATSRIRYSSGIGKEGCQVSCNTEAARAVSDLSTISVNIERNLPILNLMNVGECVKYIPRTLEFVDISGKYILWSSDLQFNKSGSWEATATINCIRTNRKI